MADRFQLFRLSLTPRDVDLLTFLAPPPNREEYLRGIFAREHRFEHWGNPFVYLPSPEQTSPFIIGQIGRPFVREENLPPDQGFALAQREAWRAAVIALDPRSYADGQKLSFSHDDIIGTPFAVLRRFIKHLNELEDPPYHLDVEPIFSPKSFWAFADAHKGEVTAVRFEFATPNMFGGSDNLSEELREFRKAERAQKVTIQVTSADGINTDTERIREGVEYAGKGAGNVIAFAKGGRRYNSKNQAETITIDDPTADAEPLLRRAMRRITEILGLE